MKRHLPLFVMLLAMLGAAEATRAVCALRQAPPGTMSAEKTSRLTVRPENPDGEAVSKRRSGVPAGAYVGATGRAPARRLGVRRTADIHPVPVRPPLGADTSQAVDTGSAAIVRGPGSPYPAPPVDGWPTSFSRPRFAAVMATVGAANTGIFLMEKDRWWKNPGARFHFKTETQYARNFDKLGHFFGTDLQALMIARCFAWSGVSHRRSVLIGSLAGLAMQTYVEINDGFYVTWGFDLLDQAANTVGAAWFYLRETRPALARFDTRWSYWPRPIRQPAHNLGSEAINSFTNNYNGQGHWMAVRVHDLLPEAIQSWWPRALMLSAGIYLDGWVGREFALELSRPETAGNVSGYLSLDLDWNVFLRRRTHLGRFAADLLNRTHLPAPAIRLAPRPQVFLLFYGQ